MCWTHVAMWPISFTEVEYSMHGPAKYCPFELYIDNIKHFPIPVSEYQSNFFSATNTRFGTSDTKENIDIIKKIMNDSV